jgi:hypothetical protein
MDLKYCDLIHPCKGVDSFNSNQAAQEYSINRSTKCDGDIAAVLAIPICYRIAGWIA